MIITYEINSQIVVPPTQSVSLSEKYSLDWKKVFAISFIIFGCLLIIIFIGIALFKPVLNRKSDYENIGLHVLGEMNSKWRDYEGKKDL